jgi:hypothetical protein
MDFSNRLLDFIYVDRQKISIILSQVLADPFVESMEVKQINEVGNDLAVSATISKIFTMVGVEANIGRKSLKETQEIVQKNPEWVQAKALVQYVCDHASQDGEINTAGRLGFVKGAIELFDFSPFKKVVDNEALKESAKRFSSTFASKLNLNNSEKLKSIDAEVDQIRSDGKKANKQSLIAELTSQKNELIEFNTNVINVLIEGICHFVQHTPFSKIAILTTESDVFWFSIKEQNLLQDYGDVILKHGSRIEGEWHIAGIIDGLPNIDEFAAQTFDPNGGWLKFLRQYSIFPRRFIGRQAEMRGIQPIVIFRDLGEMLR